MSIGSSIRSGLVSSLQSGLNPGAVANQSPTADFSSVVTLLQVDFTDASSDPDGSIIAWDWDWGDGTTHGTTQNPSHTYTTVGNKTVTLTVTDNVGATHSVQKTVTPTITKDGPSSAIYTPLTSAEWTALSLPAPSHLWLCQEASGNLAATIGTATLTANATPVYQQSVTDWTRKAVGTADGTTSQRFQSTQAALDYSAGQSIAWLVYANFTAGASTRRLFATGADTNGIRLLNTGVPQSVHNNTATSGTTSHSGATVHPWLWYRNATTNASGLMTDLEHIVGTHDESAFASSSKGIGAAGTQTAATARYLLVAFWTGSDAETIAAKATLTALGWSPGW